MSCCSIKNSTPLNYFLTLSRLFFGFWLFYAGLAKSGIFTADPNDGFGAFIYGYLVPTFEKTFLPSFLVILTGWLICIGEIVLGIALMVGKRLRCVWTLTSLLMFTLMFGQTLLQNPVDGLWLYLIFSIANGALAGSTSCCEAASDCCDGGCCDDDSCCSEGSCCDDKESSCCNSEKTDKCCSEKESCCSIEKK